MAAPAAPPGAYLGAGGAGAAAGGVDTQKTPPCMSLRVFTLTSVVGSVTGHHRRKRGSLFLKSKQASVGEAASAEMSAQVTVDHCGPSSVSKKILETR